MGCSIEGTYAFPLLHLDVRTDDSNPQGVGANLNSPEQIPDLAKLDLLESINSMRPLLLSHAGSLRMTEDLVDLWIENARGEVKDPKFGCSRKVSFSSVIFSTHVAFA